jgi:hypothetical protein
LRQHSYSDVYIRFDPQLSRLFSGSYLYSTTPMPNWRVEQHAEFAYGFIGLLFRLTVLVRCGRKKGIH